MLTLTRPRLKLKSVAVPTVRDLADEYQASRRVGVGQIRALARIVQHFGAARADRVTPALVQSYRKLRRSVADSTVRRELGALVALLNWAAKTLLIDRAMVPHIDLPAAGLPRDLFMTEQQAKHFEAAALRFPRFNGRVGVFVSLALNTGARKEAILQLTWDRVDLDERTVDYVKPGAVVTKKRRKKLPINPTLHSVLSSRAINPCDRSNLVVGQGSIRAAYTAFTVSIGMDWVTPHVLRHTAASLMLSKGVPIWEVAEVLGDTPATVARVYGHSMTAQLQGAVDVLGCGPGNIAA